MFLLPLRRLLARPRPLVATVLLLTIVLGLVPVATATLWQANEQVQADITDFARGHYDLLVRPLGAPSSVEESLGIVEENYLGVGDGGITIDTWREIAAELPLVSGVHRQAECHASRMVVQARGTVARAGGNAVAGIKLGETHGRGSG